MPYYCFKCRDCGLNGEYLMKISDCDVQELTCSECHGTMIKIPAKTNFELKGGGWADSGYSKGD